MASSTRAWDDNYAGPAIGRHDLEGIARRAQEATGRRQWMHNHPEGHLCTSSCGPLAEPAE